MFWWVGGWVITILTVTKDRFNILFIFHICFVSSSFYTKSKTSSFHPDDGMTREIKSQCMNPRMFEDVRNKGIMPLIAVCGCMIGHKGPGHNDTSDVPSLRCHTVTIQHPLISSIDRFANAYTGLGWIKLR